MKSLKPFIEETKATLIATDVANELRQQIDTLSNTVNNLSNNIDDIESQLGCNNTTKQSGTFDTINARNANITNKATIKEIDTDDIDTATICANSASIHSVTGDDATFDHIGSVDATFTCANIENISSCNIATVCVNANSVNSNTTIACQGSFNTVNAPDATFNTINATCLSLNGNLSFDTADVTTINTDTANIVEARANALNAAIIKSPYFYNRNKVFVEDETDASEFVLLGDPTDSSNTNDDARYIEMPAITGGWYRIVVKKPNGKYFAVTFINTETAPIVQYSKDENGDIQTLYYDVLTNKLYVKTYATGWIFWTNDSKNQRPAPQTYTELPVDSSLATTFQYTITGKNRLVIMGDGTADYGLAIQGLLEAKVIKDDTRFHNLFFIGDSWQALKNFADRYLTYEDHNGVKHYTDSETAGYLFHWKKEDDVATTTYRSEDGDDQEALEKISYDGTKVTLTLDTKHGQDEIEIDGTGTIESPYEVRIRSGEYDDKWNIPADHIIAVDSDETTKVTQVDAVPLNWSVLYNSEDSGGIQLSADIWYTDGTTRATTHYLYGSYDDENNVYRTWYNNVGHPVPAYTVPLDGSGHPEDPPLSWVQEQLANLEVEITYSTEDLTASFRISDDYIDNNAEITEVTPQPMPDLLPFIISITLSSYSWDIAMNDGVWNSYSNERE